MDYVSLVATWILCRQRNTENLRQERRSRLRSCNDRRHFSKLLFKTTFQNKRILKTPEVERGVELLCIYYSITRSILFGNVPTHRLNVRIKRQTSASNFCLSSPTVTIFFGNAGNFGCSLPVSSSPSFAGSLGLKRSAASDPRRPNMKE